MANIKDPAYLYVDNPQSPLHGQTVEVEMEDFKKNAKAWKQQGIRPATGKELAPIQRQMEMKIAGEHEGTAATLGALSGASFGTAPYVLEKLGIADRQAMEDLKEANPNAYGAGELGGVIATGLAGGAANLVGRALGMGALSTGAKTLGGRIARGAGFAGAQSAGSEFANQTIEGKGYDVGNIAMEGLKGVATGAALPAVSYGAGKLTGAATDKLISSIPGMSHRAGQVVDKVGKTLPTIATGALTDYAIDQKFDIEQLLLGSVLGLGGSRSLPSGSKITEGGMKAAAALSRGKDAITLMARRLQQLNPGMGARAATKLAEQLRKRAEEENQ